MSPRRVVESNVPSGPETDAKVASLKGGREAAWSTDLAVAWELLEEMRGEKCYAIAVHIGIGEGKPWECSLVTDQGRQDFRGCVGAFSDTPAGAICALYILRTEAEVAEMLDKKPRDEHNHGEAVQFDSGAGVTLEYKSSFAGSRLAAVNPDDPYEPATATSTENA